MTHARKSLGAGGERLVVGWYREQGFDVVATNWSAHDSGLLGSQRHAGIDRIKGELDLVVHLEPTLVFVEVKTRHGNRFGTGLDAVTPAKQRQVRRLARLFLQSAQFHGERVFRVVRFDAAAINTATSPYTLTVVTDAF